MILRLSNSEMPQITWAEWTVRSNWTHSDDNLALTAVEGQGFGILRYGDLSYLIAIHIVCLLSWKFVPFSWYFVHPSPVFPLPLPLRDAWTQHIGRRAEQYRHSHETRRLDVSERRLNCGSWQVIPKDLLLTRQIMMLVIFSPDSTCPLISSVYNLNSRWRIPELFYTIIVSSASCSSCSYIWLYFFDEKLTRPVSRA